MQGAGNDYIYFDCFHAPLEDPEKTAIRLSDRHFSVGGDGIVLILPSPVADAKMRMFNADGSEGNMCGNAIRCVGKFLRDVKGIQKERLTIETRSGVKTLSVLSENGAESFCVDMGKPRFLPSEIPARFMGEKVIRQRLEAGSKVYFVTCLSMGNPHCVVFCDSPETLPLEKIGPLFEHHALFPERVNTEFVKVIRSGEQTALFMRVWERGSGETLACGTGACAAAVAAVVNGYAGENEAVSVRLKGGELKIVYTGETVFMTGSAELVYIGKIDL